MPERPLLILPSPGEPLPRQKSGGGGGQFQSPSAERQAERLSPLFQRLQQALEERRARLQMEARDVVPEEVVVLETVGTVDKFVRAVEAIPGMEWLAEIEAEEIPPDDDFFALSSDGEARTDKALRGRVFMIFTNQDALRQMVWLWERWLSNKELPRNLGRWKALFQQLRDVRHWGVRDRLQETGILEDWRERVEHGQESVPCEIELWYRRSPKQRGTSRDRIVGFVEGMAGQIIAEVDVEEIAYHALLVRLPVIQIHPLLESIESDIDLVQCEQIQFFRATGQMSTSLADELQDQDQEALPEEPPAGSPVVALFDGLPLQAHRRLSGRLVVDDPDDFETDSPAVTRRHGTAMASLILHGDLAAGERPLQRRLYVRPILRPDPRDWRNHTEAVPEGTLVVDLVHRAVRRLFEGDGGEAPAAPHVSIVNLSIGIRDRPFDQALSPLARLLDWLAWRYKVLFVVSAGNYDGEIALPPAHQPGLPLLGGTQQEQVIRSVAADTRNRRLLSPAEAVNALTVASIHEDASTEPPPPGRSDPYTVAGLPSPINAQGMGYRRGIKPDMLAAGGRIVVRRALAAGTTLEIYYGTRPPGQLAASPGANPGDRGAVRHSRGTSNATALVSRACGLLYDVIDELRQEPGGEIVDSFPRAVWLKALVAHGAEWGEAGSILTRILKHQNNSRQFKEYVTRLLGYGAIDVNRVQECTARRVTALGGGALGEDESHIHRFPLPPSLSGQHGHRRLTITLAWLSPVNQRHQAWRRADLWFDPPQDPLRVRRQQADWRAVRRGTLQHEIREGERADVFVEGENLEIRVSCRAGAGALEDEVPYALAITLEVAEELGVDIYDEVRAAIHAIQVRPGAAT